MATKKLNTEEMNSIQVEDVSASGIDRSEGRKKQSAEARERIENMQISFNEQFPQEVERQLKKGGTFLTYIPVSEVITRLNKVLGFDGWSYEIIKCERDILDPDFIVAHVRLDVFPDGDRFSKVSKDGFGGQKIKRTKQGDIVDLGDEFKGAVSDALKKAAQALGVGLYLARTEEAMEAVEAATMHAVVEPVVSEEISELWNNFISLSKSLDSDGKSALNAFWTEYAGSRAKPTKQTAVAVDLEELIAECIRISFNGTDAQSE